MNIQFLTPKFVNNRINSNTQNKKVSYPKLQPLGKDTVQFTGGPKSGLKNAVSMAVNASKNKVFSFWNADDAKSHKEILNLAQSFEEPLEKFTWELKRCLKSLVATDSHPDNVIMPGKKGIKSRVKKPKSIAEKANSRELFDIESIERMGDVGGVRIVLRSASFSDGDKVFEALKDFIKRGYKLKEIENYRLDAKDSYISQRTFDSFGRFCTQQEQYVPIKHSPIPNGYTAVHLTFEVPDGKQIELQIMGRDVENVKEVEDFFYKYRCNKKFDTKFRPIQQIFDKYMPTLDDFQKETLTRYIKDSYQNARHMQSKSAKIKFNPDKEFLPFPYSLPQKLSFANLWKMMEKCQAQ